MIQTMRVTGRVEASTPQPLRLPFGPVLPPPPQPCAGSVVMLSVSTGTVPCDPAAQVLMATWVTCHSQATWTKALFAGGPRPQLVSSGALQQGLPPGGLQFCFSPQGPS